MKLSLAICALAPLLLTLVPACSPAPATAVRGAGGEITTGASGGTTTSTSSGTTSGGPAVGPTSHTATLRTLDTSQYLSATNGGGSSLDAASNIAGAFETFTLTDLDGGMLTDGDAVHVAAADGHYLSAANGGGGALTCDATTPGDDETFLVVRIAGPGVIATGDAIALETKLHVNYVSAIHGGGGAVLANAPWDHAWETFTVALDVAVGPPPDGGTPVFARQKVLDYLAATSGHGTVVGIENKDAKSPTSDSDQIASITGKTPGFWSADWGFGSGAVDHRQDIVDQGIAQWNKGAIVQYIYHACPLTQDELCSWDDIGGANPQHLSDAQWSELTTPGTTLHSAWLARLDTLSGFFQQLKDAGVAPLFRVLHEMNQGVFWWAGRAGPDGTAKLYQITHDYLVDTKGFDNIIWVWNLQDFTSLSTDVDTYNPGTAYFDIAALDVYNTGYTQENYDAMKGASGGKPIGIGECQFMPTADLLTKQPLWVYAALWPDFTGENASTLPALYGAPNVITLGGLPGWK